MGDFLFLQRSAGFGGAKMSLVDTVRALTIAGHRCRVVIGEPGALSDELTKLSIPWRLIPLPKCTKRRHSLTHCLRRRALVHELSRWGRPNIAISNELYWGNSTFELKRSLGWKSGVIVRDETFDITELKRRRTFEHECVIAISERIRDHLIELGLRPDRVHLIHDATGNAVFDAEEDRRIRARLERDHPEVQSWICAVGSIDRRKAPHRAVLALGKLLENEAPGASRAGLLLAGPVDHEYRETLERSIRESGAAGRVVLLGCVRSVRTVLDISKVLVLTSRSEALPRCLIEAVRAHRPCVSFPVSGVDEILGELSASYVSAPDTESLARTLAFALANYESAQACFQRRAEILDRLLAPARHAERFASLAEAVSEGSRLAGSQPRMGALATI